jgi:hypothetical protein
MLQVLDPIGFVWNLKNAVPIPDPALLLRIAALVMTVTVDSAALRPPCRRLLHHNHLNMFAATQPTLAARKVDAPGFVI